jgi:molybdopterin synthase catalytic subunit
MTGASAKIRARTTSTPLDPEALRRRVRTDADGAVVLFVGTVRDHSDGRRVTGLHYECYPEMADAELGKIAREAVSRWEVGRVVVEHRVGDLEIGEASVAVAVAAPHRAPCFEACRYVMEAIKERLPVWKREAYADGAETWVEGSRPTADLEGEPAATSPTEGATHGRTDEAEGTR